MSAPSVIVFGPTGTVASSAALTAHAHGAAHITLAMRNPSKPLPNAALTEAEQTHSASFSRIQADLTDPASVRTAAAASGAKVAFIYLVFGSHDGMRGAIEALKAAGVEFVVFLSSAGVREGEDPRAVSPAHFIEFQHARVEVALQEVFGDEGYVAVRPGYFASNLFQYAKHIANNKAGGEVVRLVCPEAKFDMIAPEDIGRVCGRLLVEGQQALKQGSGVNVVMLAGPQMLSQAEAVGVIGKAVGKDIQVAGFDDDEEAVRSVMQDLGMPEPGARQIVKNFKAVAEGFSYYGEKYQYERAVGNVLKYGGRVTPFAEWAEANKAKFA
ncbi:NAD(P)-binding protein [Parathielavia appendiculata]|uniref:NAD(P)-binding protein n=1 Tax=Parathielavia appendiculata TaxID=2587402 RepID=A0AAN6U8G7_9PEZI|nr:NAD(P)-binding protein [Parathielavia appendiculata]